MKNAFYLLVICWFLTGCVYLRQRGNDFLDIFKINAGIGYGVSVDAKTTELLHTGIGFSSTTKAGLDYGRLTTSYEIEQELPVSYIVSVLTNPDKAYLHHLKNISATGIEIDHKCYMIFAHRLNQDEYRKTAVHFFDVEVGATAGFLRFEFGFSIGELFDFLIGLSTIDIARDDEALGRRTRKDYEPVPAEHER